jgi:hypothetical protein
MGNIILMITHGENTLLRTSRSNLKDDIKKMLSRNGCMQISGGEFPE